MLNVMDYGAVGDGRDDTAAFIAVEAALPASGGSIEYPAPPVAYCISAPIVMSKPGRRFGDGVSSRIKAAVGNTDIFQITGQDVELEKMSFASSVTRSAGASYINCLSSWARIAHMRMDGAAVGILMGGVAQQVEDVKFRNTVPGTGVCILVNGGAVMQISKVLSEQPGEKHLATVQVLKCQDLEIQSSQLMAALYGLYVNPPPGSQVDSLKCGFTFFDGCGKGIYFYAGPSSSINRSGFVACGMSSSTAQGALLQTAGGSIDGVDFVACNTFYNNSNGIELFDAGVQNVRHIGGAIAGNSASGFAAEGGASRFAVIGSSIGSTDGIGGNAQGVAVTGGGSSGHRIIGNDTRWNTGAGISDAGSAPKFVSENL